MKTVTKEKVFHVLKLILLAVTVTLVPVSYTHLDKWRAKRKPQVRTSLAGVAVATPAYIKPLGI